MKRLYYLIRSLGFLNFATQTLLKKSLRPFILCYHQIDTNEFRDHIRALKRRFEIVDLEKFTQNLKASKQKLYCAITLDDCIREDVQKSAAVAIEEGVPIVYYLPLRYSEGKKSIWPNIIKEVIQRRNKITFQGKEYSVHSNSQKVKLREDIINHFLDLKKQTIELEELVEKWMANNDFTSGDLPGSIEVIGIEEISELAQNENIYVESHMNSHPFLNLMSEAEIESEFEDSKRDIEKYTRKPVRSLCYPYGSAEVIGDAAPALAPKYYRDATTLIQGVCSRKTDVHYMPRIGIYPGDGVRALFGKIYHYQNMCLLR